MRTLVALALLCAGLASAVVVAAHDVDSSYAYADTSSPDMADAGK